MSRHYYRGIKAVLSPRHVASANGYWEQVAVFRAQSRRPIVRYRAAVVTIAEPLVAATIVLIIYGLVGERAIFLDLAFAVSLTIIALVLITLLASACAVAVFGWQQGDGR